MSFDPCIYRHGSRLIFSTQVLQQYYLPGGPPQRSRDLSVPFKSFSKPSHLDSCSRSLLRKDSADICLPGSVSTWNFLRTPEGRRKSAQASIIIAGYIIPVISFSLFDKPASAHVTYTAPRHKRNSPQTLAVSACPIFCPAMSNIAGPGRCPAHERRFNEGIFFVHVDDRYAENSTFKSDQRKKYPRDL